MKNFTSAISRLVYALALAATALSTASCRGGAEPATEFSSFVKACTGGVISCNSTVKVEFTSGYGASANAADAISFSPSVKGTVRWVSDKLLEFTPDEGELVPGKVYEGTVDLGKIAGVKEREMKKFRFSFAVAAKKALLELENVRISASDPETATLIGTASFSSDFPADKIGEVLSFKLDGEQLSLETAEFKEVQPGYFNFSIPGIRREHEDLVLKAVLSASRYGYKKDCSAEVTIPGTEVFSVVDAVNRYSEGSPYVEVFFSNPVDMDQNPAGLFNLEGTGRCRYDRAGNTVKIYYESFGRDEIKLEVAPGVLSNDGTKLGETFRRTFASCEAKPEVKLCISGNIMPDTDNLRIPFTAVNLNAVDISVIKIYADNLLTFLQENDLDGDSELRRSGRLILRKTLRLDSDPELNLKEKNLFCIDLSGIMAKEPGAIYRVRLSFRKDYSLWGKESGSMSSGEGELVELSSDGLTEIDEAEWDKPWGYYYEDFFDWMRYDWKERDNPANDSFYMESGRFPVINLLCSNLGLIAKSADNGKLWATVTEITSAKPVRGAELTVYNYQLRKIGSGKTDAEGLAEIQTEGKPFVITAKSGNSTAYLKMKDGEENSLSRFDVGGKTVTRGIKGFIYGERGVWRPGDKVHLVLLLEDRENALPEGHPVTMEVYSPQGQFYDKQVLPGRGDGFNVFEFKTAEDDPTGIWNVYFKVGGASFHKSLHIETIKPNRIKSKLGLPNKTLQAGRSCRMEISASWLTGPAASGLRALVTMNLKENSSPFPEYKDYRFSLFDDDYEPQEFEILDRKLDDSGRLSADVKLPSVSSAPGLLQATLTTRIFEPGGDASISSSTAPFSPYTSYVGIKSSSSRGNSIETDKDQTFKLVVLDKDGKKVSGHRLSYRVIKIDWSWWWESRRRLYDSVVDGQHMNVVSSGTLTASGGEASFNFKVEYPDWGRYFILVHDETSGHITGEVYLFDWPEWRGRASMPDPEGVTMISIGTDKDSYKVGETATVYIPAAENGRALISIENGSSVLSRAWARTSAEQTRYSFPVTADMAPNFYVHVTLLQPHVHSGNDHPLRSYGVHCVGVTDNQTRLRPQISMPEVIRPQEEFTVKVKEENGRAMTYTLAIVDEGLLGITSYRTPDPWGEMYAKEALGVRTWDLYDDVIGAFNGRLASLLSIGGDEGVSKERVRDNRFNPVVKFLGPFTLNGGSDSHKITLPMYVGSVRVMVVAGKNGAYGSADKTVPVRSPLMVLPTVPRVIGCGEEFTIPANVFVMEDGISAVNVSLKINGNAKAGSDKCTLSFSGTGDKIARFSVKAGDSEGRVEFTVTAEAGGHKATETVSVEVRNPSEPLSAIDQRVLKPGESAEFAWNGKEAISASLEAAGFPSIDFNGVFTFVKDYSYFCTEQLSARGLALVSTLDLLSKANREKAQEIIPAILQQLYSRQLPDGGFSYWSGGSTADEWASSMAGQFLKSASDKGFKIDSGVFNSWKNFQKRASVNYRRSSSPALDDLQQAYRLYTLALAGASDEAAMNRLKLSENLSSQAAWRLAAAYAVAGKKNIAVEMTAGLERNVEPYRDGRSFGSSTRDKAMMLETLVLTDDIAGAMVSAKDVADAIREEYYTTQTAAFASVALGRLAGKIGMEALNISVDGKAVKEAAAVWTSELDASKGGATVRNNGSSEIFVSLVSSTRPSVGTAVEEKSEGIGIRRSFCNIAGAAMDPSSVRQGSDFYEKIEVDNISGRDLSNLALTQVIPSGWEIFDERLFGYSSRTDSEHSYKDIRDDRTQWFFDLPAGTRKTFWIRLQASFEGKFLLPAAVCRDMYDNRTSANTASGTAEVKR